MEFRTRLDWLIFFAFGGEEVIEDDDSEPEPEVDECRPVEPVDMFEIELFEVRDIAKDEESLRCEALEWDVREFSDIWW